MFGSISTLAKPIVTDFDPILLASIASLITAAVLTPITIQSKFNVSRKNIKIIFAIAILGAVIAPSLYFIGLKTTSASNATILANTEIVFTVLIATLIFRYKLNRYGGLSAILVFIGIFIITTKLDFSKTPIDLTNPGNLLIVLTMLCWSIDNNLSKILTKSIDTKRIVQLKSAIGGAVLIVLAIIFKIPLVFDASKIFNVIFLGLIGFAVPMLLFYFALKKIGTVKTILIFSTSSIFGVIFTMVFLNEQIQEYQILAMGIMVIGIVLLKKSD